MLKLYIAQITFVTSLTLSLLVSINVFAETRKSAHYQKPGANIHLITPERIQLQENGQQAVSIEISAPQSAHLILKIKIDEGIVVENLPANWSGTVSEPTLTFDTNIHARSPGRYNIMFHAEVTQGEQRSRRVFGFPVYVGEQEKQKHKNAPKYIHLPAQEKVSNQP